MKTSELNGTLLDHWVARAEGWTFGPQHKTLGCDVWRDSDGLIVGTIPAQAYEPSTNWAQGGPIIDREGIYFEPSNFEREGKLFAYVGPSPDIPHGEYGETRLIAAMRAYVASKFGDEVPDEASESSPVGADKE